MPAACRFIIAAALSAPLAGCLDGAGLCANRIVSRVDAPGGARSAVMFERDCGATTGFSTQISILRPGEAPAGKGNVLIADDDHGAAMAGDWGGPWAEIRWLGRDHLLILHATKARMFLRQEAVAGARITYRAANE